MRQLYVMMLVTCDKAVVFTWYSGFDQNKS